MSDLVVEGVHKKLGESRVLKGVSFNLDKGEVVALLGPSGSGKTTLLRAIAGLDHPDAGVIRLADRTLFDGRAGTAVPPEQRGLGLVFQSYALWPHRTVLENVEYPLRVRKVAGVEVRARALEVLRDIGLEGLSERYPHELSGGQQQRVALSRAIVYKPPLLLLDEPLSNLDAKLREEARVWLRELIERLEISAVCVTHDQVEALALADRVLLLDQGRVEQEGAPEEIYDRPRTLFAAEFMGSNNRFTGRVVETRGALARLAGDGWELWGRLRGERRVGDEATAVIRLERTRIQHTPGENCLPARLETAVYLGERWDHLYRACGLRVRAWAAAAPAQSPLFLCFPAESLWIF
ncbi:MAG: ABC transporter ATP-binding protein [Myxococcales bacterium]